MAVATPKTPRVLDEPAFVLQAHDWSESSQIIEVLSRHHGRVVLVAKGVKRPTSQFRAVLLPFQRLQVGWGGDADIKTLKQAVWHSGHVLPQGEALMSAYYLKGVAPKEVQLWTIFKGCFPFVGMVIITLALTYIFPTLVTYLPDQFFSQAEEIPYDPNDETVVDPSIFKSL